MEIESLAQDLKLRGLSKWTVNNRLQSIKRYIKFCREHAPPLDPEKGSQMDVLAYLTHLRSKGMRNSSIGQNFASLNAYFTFLIRQGILTSNPIPDIREIYLKSYKGEIRRRKLISIEEAQKTVLATVDSRDKAILVLLLKTGIRRSELINLDVADVDLKDLKLNLKSTPKRSNGLVFFDSETKIVLERWLNVRKTRLKRPDDNPALFLNRNGRRLMQMGVDVLVRDAAIRVGLYNENSNKIEDRFTPHCARHFFVTHLLKAGMKREHVKWLRGDAMRESIDLYYHIDENDVKEEYLKRVPKLDI